MSSLTEIESPPNAELVKRVKKWMHFHFYEYSYDDCTKLAEDAANEFDLYEDDVDYVIPEWVFELSAIASESLVKD